MIQTKMLKKKKIIHFLYLPLWLSFFSLFLFSSSFFSRIFTSPFFFSLFFLFFVTFSMPLCLSFFPCHALSLSLSLSFFFFLHLDRCHWDRLEVQPHRWGQLVKIACKFFFFLVVDSCDYGWWWTWVDSMWFGLYKWNWFISSFFFFWRFLCWFWDFFK